MLLYFTVAVVQCVPLFFLMLFTLLFFVALTKEIYRNWWTISSDQDIYWEHSFVERMEREWETVKGETAKGKTAKGENLFIFRNSEWMGKQHKGEFIGETMIGDSMKKQRRVIQRGNHKDNSSLGGIGKGKLMGNLYIINHWKRLFTVIVNSKLGLFSTIC